MGMAAWVCFECRIAVRRDTQYRGQVPCPECGKHCVYLGYKIPVPPKSKPRLWQQLQVQLVQAKILDNRQAALDNIRLRHVLEREFAKIERLPENPGRRSLLQQLRSRLLQL
ncbi:hypothetical protein CO613_01300 [Lysobacteraceae bacterium NML07-0707]|nr:hypothetical protein CO613_01300 [Xanthomonadaceae bacterium NML07-0707]